MNPAVEVERLVPYPAEEVFAVWLDGPAFAEWFLPDANVRLGRVVLDPREGGAFLIEMLIGPDVVAHTGVYRRIIPNRELVFTWRSAMTGERDSLVEVTFEPRATSTLVRLRHTGLSSDEVRTAHQAGWTRILAGVEPFLAKE